MKHKTLFRLIIKAMGLFFTVWALPGLLRTLLAYTSNALQGAPANLEWWMVLEPIPALVQIAIGLYLFLGGEWIVNRCIPSNRPYCPECGYDVSKAKSPRCPECGAALPRGKGEAL